MKWTEWMDRQKDRLIDLNHLSRGAIKGYARKKIVHSHTCFYHPLFFNMQNKQIK